MLFSTLCAALLSLTSAVIVGKRGEGGLEKAEIEHRLRVCNAYPSSHALKVLRNGKEFMGNSQMKYKECTELKGPLKEKDQLNFETDGVPLSTFTVSDLPQGKSTLILVAYRESNSSTRILFKSHVFTASKLAQVAVIDTFQGKAQSDLLISQILEANKTGVFQETLEMNTVMDLAAGVYQVKISSSAFKGLAGPFMVEEGEDYVVLRTGLDDPKSSLPSFLQDKQESDSPTTGGAFFRDTESLLATHTGLTHPAGGTGGPGFAHTIHPDVPVSFSADTGGDHGESLEQFLGLARLERYPEQFVVYPLVKPKPMDKTEEHSGATAPGFTAALAAVFLVAAML